MLSELLDGAKKDIVVNVQESIDQIYFEYAESETGAAKAQVNPVAKVDTAVATKIDNFIQPKPLDPGKGYSSDFIKS